MGHPSVERLFGPKPYPRPSDEAKVALVAKDEPFCVVRRSLTAEAWLSASSKIRRPSSAGAASVSSRVNVLRARMTHPRSCVWQLRLLCASQRMPKIEL